VSSDLRDIKPLLEIPDYSYYLYIGLIFLAFFVVLALLFFILKIFWLNRQVDMQKVYFERLEAVDWIDSKKSAYAVTYLAHKFIDNEKVKEIYEQTLPLLEPYKYRKDVPPVDDETLRQYNFLVHVIDESL